MLLTNSPHKKVMKTVLTVNSFGGYLNLSCSITCKFVYTFLALSCDYISLVPLKRHCAVSVNNKVESAKNYNIIQM